MKKLTQSIFIFLVVLTSATSTVKAQVTGNYCPSYIQSQTQWCWAASSQMVYWCYKPGTIQQCDAANVSKTLEFNTGCGNLANSNLSACSYPSTFNNPQSMYGCAGSLQSILSNYAISSTSFASSLTAATLTTAMTNRRLVIARWGWNGGGGHFIVVNRYKSGNVYFNNPLSGSVIWTYNTFKTANGAGNWTHSLRMNSSCVYGSILYRESNTESTKTLNQDFNINMYPNPATDKINVLLNGTSNQDNRITIIDAVGKPVLSKVVSKDETSTSFDVANWPRGMYILTVNNNSSLSKKFTLQ